MERILRATEELLEGGPLESVTVAEIVRLARTSVGSFYARFPSKEALLPALYSLRYGPEHRRRSEEYLRHFASRAMPLERRATEVVGHIVAYYRNNRQLLRELGLQARRDPGSVAPEAREHRDAFHAGWATAFGGHAHEIASSEPELTVRFGLFLVAAACRDAIVFAEGATAAPEPPEGAEAPAARPTSSADLELFDSELARELSRVLVSYLRGGSGSSGAEVEAG